LWVPLPRPLTRLHTLFFFFTAHGFRYAYRAFARRRCLLRAFSWFGRFGSFHFRFYATHRTPHHRFTTYRLGSTCSTAPPHHCRFHVAPPSRCTGSFPLVAVWRFFYAYFATPATPHGCVSPLHSLRWFTGFAQPLPLHRSAHTCPGSTQRLPHLFLFSLHTTHFSTCFHALPYTTGLPATPHATPILHLTHFAFPHLPDYATAYSVLLERHVFTAPDVCYRFPWFAVYTVGFHFFAVTVYRNFCRSHVLDVYRDLHFPRAITTNTTLLRVWVLEPAATHCSRAHRLTGLPSGLPPFIPDRTFTPFSRTCRVSPFCLPLPVHCSTCVCYFILRPYRSLPALHLFAFTGTPFYCLPSPLPFTPPTHHSRRFHKVYTVCGLPVAAFYGLDFTFPRPGFTAFSAHHVTTYRFLRPYPRVFWLTLHTLPRYVGSVCRLFWLRTHVRATSCRTRRA